MENHTGSWQGHKYTQMYERKFGWTQVFSMTLKSYAHANDGVLKGLIMDGSNEQTMREFMHRSREDGCHTKQT
jgi:hypothetical protein